MRAAVDRRRVSVRVRRRDVAAALLTSQHRTGPAPSGGAAPASNATGYEEELFAIITDPALIVTSIVWSPGSVARATVWVAEAQIVIGRTLGEDLFELTPATPSLLAYHLADLVGLTPAPSPSRTALTSPREALHGGDWLPAAPIRHWELSSVRARSLGGGSHGLEVVDLGSMGLWRVTGGDIVTLDPTTEAIVLDLIGQLAVLTA